MRLSRSCSPHQVRPSGRSLSLWTCAELANTLMRDGLVSYISPQSVQRILQSQKLKPWRVHHWLSPKTPRDEAFTQQTLNIMDLYTRPPGAARGDVLDG